MPALRWTIAAALTLIAVATARVGSAAEGLDYRWLYLQQNLQMAENLIPGDFEERKGHTFSGWSFQDEPGTATFADESVRHGGHTAATEHPTSKWWPPRGCHEVW